MHWETGKKTAVFKRHRFYKNKENQGSLYLSCDARGCKRRLILNPDGAVIEKGPVHNHDASKAECEATDAVEKESTSRIVEFLATLIKKKESDLECPVCLETAEVSIFMCPEMHLICSSAPAVFSNANEKTAEELKKLRAMVTSTLVV